MLSPRQIHLETFDVSGMIEEIVTTLQPAIEKNRNTLRVNLADEVGMMRADITKVRQILLNLLSNACKFTDHGTISVDVDQSIAEGLDLLRFRITDTEIGISAKQQEHLFQEFAQADTSIARMYGGTGLGLAITHRFVQLMKGRIEVESQPGEAVPCLGENAPPLDFRAGPFAKEREIWTAYDRVIELHATLVKDQRFFVTTEIDLLKRFGVGAGGASYDVVNHVPIIRLQCSWHRGNSLSIAHEVHLYLRTGSLPLDLVVAGFELRAADLYGVRNLY